MVNVVPWYTDYTKVLVNPCRSQGSYDDSVGREKGIVYAKNKVSVFVNFEVGFLKKMMMKKSAV